MPLDRQSIIATAFEVLDRQGVEGLSTRRLAEALGVSGPSLYWHFKTKRELFDAMTEAMLNRALAGMFNPPSDFDWTAWLAEGARSIRCEILSHKDGAMVLVGYQPTRQAVAPSALILSRLGLDPRESQLILHTLGRFVVGWTLDEQTRGNEPDADAAFEFALGIFVRGAEAMAADLLAKRSAKAG